MGLESRGPACADSTTNKVESISAGIAGFGILGLCVLGGYAESTREGIFQIEDLPVLEKEKNGDVVSDKVGTVRTIVISFFLTCVIDIVVAVALLAFCVARACYSGSGEVEVVALLVPLPTILLAVIAALFRVAYVCVLAACLNGLAQVPGMLLQKQEDAASEAELGVLIKQHWEAFALGFNGVALGLFGLHLGLLGVVLAFLTTPTAASTASSSGVEASSSTASTHTPSPRTASISSTQLIVAILLAVAGFGYTGDAVGIFLQDATYGLAKNGCFVGEVVFMVWLLKVWWSTRRSSVNNIEESRRTGSSSSARPFLAE
ncbi:unnamed protein product [Amoebophrya sp. A25]|nr:unnamed protein product [Amoebophrya sp. A25]|eukprot:GSA25T00014423001.1